MTTASYPNESPAARPGRRWALLSEAVRYSRLSESSLRRLAEQGRIRLYKPSARRVLIDLNEVDAAMGCASATA